MKYKNKILNTRVDSEDEDIPNGLQGSIQGYNKPTLVNDFDFYLDEPIGEPAYYRSLLQYMLDMQEHDSLRIWINTPGGNLASTLAIISGMQNTQGNVTCIINGSAYSAGSMIALCSPTLIVGDYADMMLHTASYGAGGKSSDITSKVRHSDTQLKRIMQDCYQGFLTPEELDLMLQGKDYWFDTDEICARLEKRTAWLESLVKPKDNPEEEPTPTKVKPKKPKPKV